MQVSETKSVTHIRVCGNNHSEHAAVVTEGDLVILVREPINPVGSAVAILVYPVGETNSVGRVRKSDASYLAPAIDSGRVTLEDWEFEVVDATNPGHGIQLRITRRL
jgi:hypothetical protein